MEEALIDNIQNSGYKQSQRYCPFEHIHSSLNEITHL